MLDCRHSEKPLFSNITKDADELIEKVSDRINNHQIHDLVHNKRLNCSHVVRNNGISTDKGTEVFEKGIL